MLPSLILVDKNLKHTDSADIYPNYIKVHPDKKRELLEGLKLFFPDIVFTVRDFNPKHKRKTSTNGKTRTRTCVSKK